MHYNAEKIISNWRRYTHTSTLIDELFRELKSIKMILSGRTLHVRDDVNDDVGVDE